jgi:TolB protein
MHPELNRLDRQAWPKRKPLLLLLSFAVFVLCGNATPSATETVGAFEEHGDVGITPRAGAASFDSVKHVYSVTGGGANMWETTDAFHFVWRRMTGDVTISTAVSFESPEHEGHTKAGVMIRQGMGTSDAYADAIIHRDGLTSLQYREKSSAETKEVRVSDSAPQFIRLHRHGNTFTMSVAGADHKFHSVGSAVVQLQDPVYVGLAVCSHDANDLQTAAFRQVQVSGRSAGK